MDNSLKDKVLESADIVAVIGERVSLTRRGKEFVGLCPFHPDHRPSMSVSPQKRIFKCWSCGAGGDVIRFVEMAERVSFPEALQVLARRLGIDVRTSPEDRRQRQQRDELQQVVTWARQHFRRNLASGEHGQVARAYARRRGLSDETIERFEIGLAVDSWDDLLSRARQAGLGLDLLEQAGLVATNDRGRTYDRFRNRLIFPIADGQGRPIAFGGRALGDDPAKYLNSPETGLFSKSRILYGLDLARTAIERSRTAIVVEGYLDAVLLHQFGFENVVATLGTALTDAHAALLRSRADTLVLCFDGDDAGARAADRAVEVALQTPMTVRVVVLDGGQDPADCVLAGGAEAFQACLKGANDALEFKWSQTLSAFTAGGRQSRRTAAENYLGFVAKATVAGGVDPLEQNLLIGRLSELLGVPAEEVFELLNQAKRTQRRGGNTSSDATALSAYQESIRSLSGGLVVVVESILGLLLIDPGCWERVDDAVADVATYSETWQRLYETLLEVHRDVGEYSIEQIMSRCEDGALCELVGRARHRVVGIDAPREEFAAVHRRLVTEQEVLRMGALRSGVRDAAEVAPSSDSSAAAFRSLCEIARGQDRPLPAESLWRPASSTSPRGL